MRRPSVAPLEYRTGLKAVTLPEARSLLVLADGSLGQTSGGATMSSTLVETLEDEVPTVLVVAKFIGDLQQVTRALCPPSRSPVAARIRGVPVAPRGPAALHSPSPHMRRRTGVRLVRTLGATPGGGHKRRSFSLRERRCGRAVELNHPHRQLRIETIIAERTALVHQLPCRNATTRLS
jgi:hypothetical protein